MQRFVTGSAGGSIPSSSLRGFTAACASALIVGLLLLGTPCLAFDAAADAPVGRSGAAVLEQGSGSPHVLGAKDSVDLEDHSGYSGEYIFGLTKGIMRSTLVPALKPVCLLLTVPLDIVFLPFAAIGGFFR